MESVLIIKQLYFSMGLSVLQLTIAARRMVNNVFVINRVIILEVYCGYPQDTKTLDFKQPPVLNRRLHLRHYSINITHYSPNPTLKFSFSVFSGVLTCREKVLV